MTRVRDFASLFPLSVGASLQHLVMRSFTDRALQPEIRVGHWRNVRMSPSRNLEIELSETILGRGLKLHPSHDHKLEERESCCCEGKTQEIRVETASTSSVSRSLPLCLCVMPAENSLPSEMENGRINGKSSFSLFPSFLSP